MGNSVLLQTVCGTSPSEIRRVSTLLSSAHLGLLYFAKRGSKVDNSDLEHRRMARLSADQRCFNFTSFDDGDGRFLASVPMTRWITTRYSSLRCFSQNASV